MGVPQIPGVPADIGHPPGGGEPAAGGGGGGDGGSGPPGFSLPGGGGGGAGGGHHGKKPPKDPELSAAESLYLKLWGQKPPAGYLEGLIGNGMNLYEIQLHEQSKPAFAMTQAYQDERTSMEITLARFLGIAV